MALTKACCFLRLPRSTTCNPDCTSCGAAGMMLPVAPFQKREGILKCVLKLSRSTAIPCCWPGFGRLRGAAVPNQQGRMQGADCTSGRTQFLNIGGKHSDLCCAVGWWGLVKDFYGHAGATKTVTYLFACLIALEEPDTLQNMWCSWSCLFP